MAHKKDSRRGRRHEQRGGDHGARREPSQPADAMSARATGAETRAEAHQQTTDDEKPCRPGDGQLSLTNKRQGDSRACEKPDEKDDRAGA